MSMDGFHIMLLWPTGRTFLISRSSINGFSIGSKYGCRKSLILHSLALSLTLSLPMILILLGVIKIRVGGEQRALGSGPC
jgi:hypothetical protein